MRLIIVMTLALLSVTAPVFAYKQMDVIKLAAPNDTPIKLLLGYDSTTGTFVEQCISANNLKKTSGKDPDGKADFRFVQSMQEVLQEENLDVSVKLSIQVPLAGVSANADVEQFKSKQSSVEQGMLYGTFRDLKKPRFVSPNTRLRLNNKGSKEFERSIKKVNPAMFRKQCGDSAVVGFQQGRHIRVFGNLRSTSNQSQEDKSTKLKLAARYLMSKFSANVELNTLEKKKAKELKVAVAYTTSGNARFKGATNLRELRKVWRDFTELPLKQTLSTSYVYIVQYKDLLPKDEFTLGVSRKQIRDVENIVNGLLVLDRARVKAKQAVREASTKQEKARYQITLDRLNKEIKQIRLWLKDNNGCTGKKGDSKACQNQGNRLRSLAKLNKSQTLSFLKLATRPSTKACAHYPVTAPSGRTKCRQCGLAKQPIFLNGKDGACGYLAEQSKAKNSVRLWAKDLKSSKMIEAEAGVKTAVAVYPNYCNKRNKKCGQATADRICQREGYGQSTDHQIWHAGGLGVVSAKPRTVYENGKTCRVNPDGFERKLCKTFVYVDCGKA